jgi:hypothetical protein
MKNKQCYKIIQKKLFSAARFFGKKTVLARKNEGLTVLTNYSEKNHAVLTDSSVKKQC